MRKRNRRFLRQSGRESGFALLALVALVAMMSMYYIVGSMRRTSSEVVIERIRTNAMVLQEAKAALIAYAASQAWESGSTDQPGSLPCPGTDEDQTALISCTASAATRKGWFPWKKIGVPKLRDQSGTPLWYALSANFRRASPPTTVINSDTQGSLDLYDDQNSTGSPKQSAIVAVIIAPGPPVAISAYPVAVMQNRLVNDISNYLDCRNASATDGLSSSPPPSTYTAYCSHNADTQTTEIFNDQIITITQAELMAAVEPAVAARIARDIVPDLRTYYAQWGHFPYPSSFTASPGNPGTNTASGTPSTRLQSSYVGDNTMTAGRGLMPITNSVTYPWVAGSGAVAIAGGTAGGVTVTSCATIASPSGWKCSFTINAVNLGNPGYLSSTTCRNPANGTRYQYCIVNPAFTVAGDVNNAGLSFAKINPTTDTDVTIKNTSGSTSRTMSSRSISWILKSDGSGKATFTFSGTHSYSNYSSSNFTRSMAVTIPDRVNVSPSTSSADATAGWFIGNEWYRQIYYIVSPGFLPGNNVIVSPPAIPWYTGNCTLPGPPTCLTVSGFSTTTYPTTNDKRALLIMGGYSLSSSLSRPQAALSAYFEGINATPGGTNGYSYQHHIGPPTTTNDRVIVIAP